MSEKGEVVVVVGGVLLGRWLSSVTVSFEWLLRSTSVIS